MSTTTHRPLRAILADIDTAGTASLSTYRELANAVRAHVEQDPGTLPAHVHGDEVVSAFRQLPLYGRLDDTYTVITRDGNRPPSEPRYSVFRARFAPALGRWSIATDYAVDSGLTWTAAAAEFAERVTQRVS